MHGPPDIAWSVPTDWTPETPQSRKITGQIDSHHDIGVPVGGIGTGGISRGPSGGFTRWTLKAGTVHYFEHEANGFALWQQPSTKDGPHARALRNRPSRRNLPGWNFDPSGTYSALHPKAWHSYPAVNDRPVGLTLEQISPVVPKLGADIDLPVGLFRAHLRNTSDRQAAAALMFTFANLIGWFDNPHRPGRAEGIAGQFNEQIKRDGIHGVRFGRKTAEPHEGDGEMLICALDDAGLEITCCPSFDPGRNGEELWRLFSADGRISPIGAGWTSGGGFSEFAAAEPSGAVAARCVLAPGEARTIDLCLVFDLPVIRFGQGRRWKRHYTQNWGGNGDASIEIAKHAFASRERWSSAIDAFHQQCSDRLNLPAGATALAVNELYFLVDGLSVWTAATEDQPDHFAIIECPDYPLFNTLDLWVYGAHAVAAHFPQLAGSVTRDFVRQVSVEDTEIRHHLRSRRRFQRQSSGMLPHDLGAPNADPFICANDYIYQDSRVWKDLNTQFVLTAWRDVQHASDAVIAETYESVLEAMDALLVFDRDGDGLIENDGIPDQTFDNVPMSGVSAYCGGLWLAAMRATADMAKRLGDGQEADKWQARSALAEPRFDELLWNGSHYRVDTDGAFSDALFSEQLFGPALARMYELGDVVPVDHAVTALRTIYQGNFLEAGTGCGAVSVTSLVHDSSSYAPEGETGLQWDEILIGFNYSLAAQLRVYGLEEECRTLMSALARELGGRRGLMFRTPAAIEPHRPVYRSQMNMRPLAVWMLAYAQVYRNGYSQDR